MTMREKMMDDPTFIRYCPNHGVRSIIIDVVLDALTEPTEEMIAAGVAASGFDLSTGACRRVLRAAMQAVKEGK